jgi:hypothetical protein
MLACFIGVVHGYHLVRQKNWRYRLLVFCRLAEKFLFQRLRDISPLMVPCREGDIEARQAQSPRLGLGEQMG